MRLRSWTIAAVAAGLAAPAGATAQTPAGGHMELGLDRVHRLGGISYALAGQRLVVRGVVRPYIAGQSAIVRVRQGDRRLLTRRVTIKPGGSDGTTGRFVLGLRPRRTGRITIGAEHEATAQQARLIAPGRRVRVVGAQVSGGSRGPAVRLLQRGLDRLRYAVPLSGVFDGGTARAVLAYRKLNGMRRTSEVTRDLLERVLRGRGRFKVRYPSHGKHVEADLSRQVLALIRPGGKVDRIYMTSSGTSATPTVRGSYRFYLKTPGTNAKGMVHSSYFIRGYAIHGYASVPVYPASHGCLRVPIPNALTIFRWLNVGDRIDVYR